MASLIRNRVKITAGITKLSALLGIQNDTQNPIDAEKVAALQRAIEQAKEYIYRAKAACCRTTTAEMEMYQVVMHIT